MRLRTICPEPEFRIRRLLRGDPAEDGESALSTAAVGVGSSEMQRCVWRAPVLTAVLSIAALVLASACASKFPSASESPLAGATATDASNEGAWGDAVGSSSSPSSADQPPDVVDVGAAGSSTALSADATPTPVRTCDHPIPREEAERIVLQPRQFWRGQLKPNQVISARFVDPTAGTDRRHRTDGRDEERECHWVLDVAGDGSLLGPLGGPNYRVTGAVITLDAVTGKERSVTYREVLEPTVPPTVVPPSAGSP